MSDDDEQKHAEGMLEYLARENERLAELVRQLVEDGVDRPELAQDAQQALIRYAADRPAVDKRIAKLRRNRDLLAKRVPPKGQREGDS